METQCILPFDMGEERKIVFVARVRLAAWGVLETDTKPLGGKAMQGLEPLDQKPGCAVRASFPSPRRCRPRMQRSRLLAEGWRVRTCQPFLSSGILEIKPNRFM